MNSWIAKRTSLLKKTKKIVELKMLMLRNYRNVKTKLRSLAFVMIQFLVLEMKMLV
jgi:hypothetical protein